MQSTSSGAIHSVNPFSATYGAITAARNLLYDSGFFSGKLRGPVVSIGSPSMGGAGKTPFLILLGELLKAHSVAFDVLSRGYGRATRGVRLVDASGSAREFGDEPLLIARKLQVPVIVGEERYDAGAYAEQKFGPQIHLLDDGFQHRSLRRDFDIVLLTERDLRDRLFPMGRLREPLTSLERAHAVVLMDRSLDTRVEVRDKFLWKVDRSVRIGDTPPGQIAFCGIARPNNFFRALQQSGLEPAATVVFRDHHVYGKKDIDSLLRLRDQKKTQGFVTTEKDAINLEAFIERLAPVFVVPLRMEMHDSQGVIESLLASIMASV
ncbi:MAG TPA: tetraacyldisaccharide 4'-kinase [Terriglobales bacterium]|nr:tetraacyldisaccharide 4'-kinase [Terriglobales bacterium]